MKTDGYMEDAQGRLVPLDQICIECPRQNCEGCRVAELRG